MLTSIMWALAELLFSLLDSFLYVCLHLNELFLQTDKQTLKKTDKSTDNKGPHSALYIESSGICKSAFLF